MGSYDTIIRYSNRSYPIFMLKFTQDFAILVQITHRYFLVKSTRSYDTIIRYSNRIYARFMLKIIFKEVLFFNFIFALVNFFFIFAHSCTLIFVLIIIHYNIFDKLKIDLIQ